MKITLTLACIAALGLAGCQNVPPTPTPHLDDHFGEAVNQAKARQTLNPEASRNTDPVAGVDGKAGKAAMDNYQKSMEKTPEPATIINIGGGLSGGSTTSSGQ